MPEFLRNLERVSLFPILQHWVHPIMLERDITVGVPLLMWDLSFQNLIMYSLPLDATQVYHSVAFIMEPISKIVFLLVKSRRFYLIN